MHHLISSIIEFFHPLSPMEKYLRECERCEREQEKASQK